MNLGAFHTWLNTSGPTAWVIMFASVILLVASAERLYFLFFEYAVKADEALASIRTAVLARDYAKALQICNTSTASPDLLVIKSGLMAVDHGREAMKSALGGAVLEVSRAVEKRVP